MVLALPLVDVNAIKAARFKVVVDAVNSIGGVAIPTLLRRMGVEVVELYCEPNGNFPHNPEPLPENLTAISVEVVKQKAQLGVVVDPDVDRLALVCEDGTMFGEEYTLVAVADYVLSKVKGNTASNLSSSQALRDVTQNRGGNYFAAAVGEVNVVEVMKKHSAVIGGEGNGGVIYPELHYGRDALVGVALFLTHLAQKHLPASELRSSYPEYYMSLNQNIGLTGGNLYVSSDLMRTDQLGSDRSTSYLTTPVMIGFKQPISGYNSLRWQRKIEPLKYEEAKRRYLQDMEMSIRTTSGRVCSNSVKNSSGEDTSTTTCINPVEWISDFIPSLTSWWSSIRAIRIGFIP